MAKSMEMAQSANVSPAKGFAAWQALTKALFDDYRPKTNIGLAYAEPTVAAGTA